MERIEYKDIHSFVTRVMKSFEYSGSEHTIGVYGKYDFIKHVLENLIINGYSIANEIVLRDYNVDHHNKEFALYLTKDGINVEKIWRNGKYLYSYSEIAFVHDECNSMLLKYIDSISVFEVAIADDDDCGTDKLQEKESRNAYTVTVKCDLDAEEALEIIKDMETRISRMNDAFAEMDRFRKLFNW